MFVISLDRKHFFLKWCDAESQIEMYFDGVSGFFAFVQTPIHQVSLCVGKGEQNCPFSFERNFWFVLKFGPWTINLTRFYYNLSNL